MARVTAADGRNLKQAASSTEPLLDQCGTGKHVEHHKREIKTNPHIQKDGGTTGISPLTSFPLMF